MKKKLNDLIKRGDAFAAELDKMSAEEIAFGGSYPWTPLIEFGLNKLDLDAREKVQKDIAANFLVRTNYETICNNIKQHKIKSLEEYDDFTSRRYSLSIKNH